MLLYIVVCVPPTPAPTHNGNSVSSNHAASASSISNQMGAPLQPPLSHGSSHGLQNHHLHQHSLGPPGLKGRSSPKLPPNSMNLSTSGDRHMSHHHGHGNSAHGHGLHGMSSVGRNSHQQNHHSSNKSMPTSKVPSLLKGVCVLSI